jgi:hypothetical protein
MSTEQDRDRLARDRGYSNYHYAHDAVRQDIDAEISAQPIEEIVKLVTDEICKRYMTIRL